MDFLGIFNDFFGGMFLEEFFGRIFLGEIFGRIFSHLKTPILFFSAERLKRDFDKAFGAPWNVIVGECYSFDIDYDFHFIYYFLYGPVAILAWRGSFISKGQLISECPL